MTLRITDTQHNSGLPYAGVIMLSVAFYLLLGLSVNMLNIIMLSVVWLNVVRLSVVAPLVG
jgi:hypothetical protein